MAVDLKLFAFLLLIFKIMNDILKIYDTDQTGGLTAQ